VRGASCGPGGPGARDAWGGPVWRAKPTIAPHGRDIGGNWRKPPANGSGGLWDAGEGPVAGLGGLEPEMQRGAQFGGQNRQSRGTGAISVGPAGNSQPTVAGACGMWEKHHLKGWGPGARYAQGGAVNYCKLVINSVLKESIADAPDSPLPHQSQPSLTSSSLPFHPIHMKKGGRVHEPHWVLQGAARPARVDLTYI